MVDHRQPPVPLPTASDAFTKRFTASHMLGRKALGWRPDQALTNIEHALCTQTGALFSHADKLQRMALASNAATWQRSAIILLLIGILWRLY